MNAKRLRWNLENWASWMSARCDDGDYSRRAGSGLGNHLAADFDTMVEIANQASAEAVNAVLDGMLPRHRLTVYNHHLETVWRIGGDPDDNYSEALALLGSGLDRRGIY